MPFPQLLVVKGIRLTHRRARRRQCKRLCLEALRNVLDQALRIGKIAHGLEFQVLPTRAKRGRE